MEVKEILETVLAAAYNTSYKFTEEFKSLFKVKYFADNIWFRLDEQPVIIYSEEYNNLVEEILVKLRYNYGSSKRKVANKDFIETGNYCHYYLIDDKKYKKIVIILNKKILIQLQTFKLELGKNTNTVEILKEVKSVGRESMAEINKRLRDAGAITANQTLHSKLVSEKGNSCKYILKLCVQNQIGYISNRTEQVIDHCFKADVSSAFPSQLLKAIPTTKYCLINKITEPNEDYQFVFHYKKNSKFGQLKIYNELDTEIDNNSKFLKDNIYQMYKSNSRKETLDKIKLEEDEIYIACRAADITLADIMKDLYNEKLSGDTPEEVKKAKLVMNSFIGYCQLNNNPALAFLAAVVIARQNHMMIERCNKLEETGNQILYIATDCIIWRGIESSIATTDKFLGSFTYENKNCKYYGVQVGSYQIEQNGKVNTYCSYLENGPEKENLRLGQLPRPKQGEKKIWQE